MAQPNDTDRKESGQKQAEQQTSPKKGEQQGEQNKSKSSQKK